MTFVRQTEEDVPLIADLFCPYCLGAHVVTQWQQSGEHFFAFMQCPDVGEVRTDFKFKDKWERLTELDGRLVMLQKETLL